MKKHTILGIAAAAMLAIAPTASAGYWTIHSEVLQSIVENVVTKLLQQRETNQSSERAAQPKTVKHVQTDRTPVKR